jgi:hypothetical protein
VRRGVALGLLLLAGAGCQESMTEKITRECDEAAHVYFAARAYAPTYWADPAAGPAWEREKAEFQRKHREAEEKERYVSDPDGKLRDALLVAWLHQSVAIDKRRPAKREPTAAKREERQAAHEQWEIEVMRSSDAATVSPRLGSRPALIRSITSTDWDDTTGSGSRSSAACWRCDVRLRAAVGGTRRPRPPPPRGARSRART